MDIDLQQENLVPKYLCDVAAPSISSARSPELPENSLLRPLFDHAAEHLRLFVRVDLALTNIGVHVKNRCPRLMQLQCVYADCCVAACDRETTKLDREAAHTLRQWNVESNVRVPKLGSLGKVVTYAAKS